MTAGRARVVFALLATCVICAAPAAGPALAAVDATYAASVRYALHNAKRVRVWTRDGTVELRTFELSEAGISFQSVLSTNVRRPVSVPGRIAWHEIRRIDVRGAAGRSPGRAALTWGAAGALAGLVVAVGYNSQPEAFLIAPAAGAGAGALFGLAHRTPIANPFGGWRTVYTADKSAPADTS